MQPPLALLQEALQMHGLEAARVGDRLSVEHGRLQFEADTQIHAASDGSVTLSLEVRAFTDALPGGPILETFANNAATEALALSGAFSKFLLGSFHVLIESLTSHECAEEQAQVERWANDGAAWDVYSGPLLTQSVGASTMATNYPDFMAALTTMFQETAPIGSHWIRVFIASYHGSVQATEVLLDNEPWEEAHALLASREWTCTHDYQSLRHFLLAIPVTADAAS